MVSQVCDCWVKSNSINNLAFLKNPLCLSYVQKQSMVLKENCHQLHYLKLSSQKLIELFLEVRWRRSSSTSLKDLSTVGSIKNATIWKILHFEN